MRSDIYAVGAVLYEMATGQRPFPQTQGPASIGAILHESPAPLRSVNPRVMPGLESLILKTLEKMPSKRYQTAREFRTALENVTASRTIPQQSTEAQYILQHSQKSEPS